MNDDLRPPAFCHVCGCTEEQPCLDSDTDQPCTGRESGICSACTSEGV